VQGLDSWEARLEDSRARLEELELRRGEREKELQELKRLLGNEANSVERRRRDRCETQRLARFLEDRERAQVGRLERFRLDIASLKVWTMQLLQT
jgi:hypothetical protein